MHIRSEGTPSRPGFLLSVDSKKHAFFATILLPEQAKTPYNNKKSQHRINANLLAFLEYRVTAKTTNIDWQSRGHGFAPRQLH